MDSAEQRGSGGRAACEAVLRNRKIQKVYLERKKVPLLALPCIAGACTLSRVHGVWHYIIMSSRRHAWGARRGACLEALTLPRWPSLACSRIDLERGLEPSNQEAEHDDGLHCEIDSASLPLTWMRPAPLQSKRQALLASIQELEAQYEELRAEMLPLWERHIALTEALPADLQQVRTGLLSHRWHNTQLLNW